PGFWVVHERGSEPVRTGLLRGGLAEEIVLLEGGEAGVCVAAADEAELVRIRAELRLKLESVLESRAGVFEFEHLLLLGRAAVEVGLVPPLVVGELIIRREERMGLAVALHLRRFVEPLPLGALLGVLAVNRFAESLDDWKHLAVAQVAVMRDGEDAAASFLFVVVHPFPEVHRIDAAEWCGAGHGLDLDGLVAVVAEDDVAVEVVALAKRGPL